MSLRVHALLIGEPIGTNDNDGLTALGELSFAFGDELALLLPNPFEQHACRFVIWILRDEFALDGEL